MVEAADQRFPHSVFIRSNTQNIPVFHGTQSFAYLCSKPVLAFLPGLRDTTPIGSLSDGETVVGGRFGKYGEHKRMKRLREAGERPKTGPAPVLAGKDFRHSHPRSIVLREIRPEDVSFISTLAGEAFNRYGPYEKSIRQWFETDAAFGYLAFAAKREAGFVIISSAYFLTTVISEVMAIAVAPEQRRKGIAGLLLEKAEQRAIEEGALYMLLHTATENKAARSFFGSHGYKMAGKKPRYYPAGQDAIRMIKALKRDRV